MKGQIQHRKTQTNSENEILKFMSFMNSLNVGSVLGEKDHFTPCRRFSNFCQKRAYQ